MADRISESLILGTWELSIFNTLWIIPLSVHPKDVRGVLRGCLPCPWPAREGEKPVRKAARAFVDAHRKQVGS